LSDHPYRRQVELARALVAADDKAKADARRGVPSDDFDGLRDARWALADFHREWLGLE